MIKKIVFAVVISLAIPVYSFAETVLWLKGNSLCFPDKHSLFQFKREAANGHFGRAFYRAQKEGKVFTVSSQRVTLMEIDGLAFSIKLQSGEIITVFKSALAIEDK
jgi:hypothetical protein